MTSSARAAGSFPAGHLVFFFQILTYTGHIGLFVNAEVRLDVRVFHVGFLVDKEALE